MKKHYSLLIAFLSIVIVMQGQTHLFMEEQEIELEEDYKSTAWVFPVARNLEEALKDIKDYCKDRSDVKLKKGGENVLHAEKVSIPSIAPKRGDLIAHAFITESYYGMALAFKLGYDISVNSAEWEAEMQNLRNYAREFMAYHFEHSYARILEGIEKEIKGLEKEKDQNENKMASIGKKVDNLNKKIDKETDEAKITGFKAEISILEGNIAALSQTLPPLQDRIDEFKENRNTIKTESHTILSTIGSL